MLWDAVIRCEVDSLHILHVGQVQLVEATLVGVGDVGKAEVMPKVLKWWQRSLLALCYKCNLRIKDVSLVTTSYQQTYTQPHR